MICAQIFNMISVGIVVIDKEFKVEKWNRWMETHSKIAPEKIIGHSIFEYFPKLETKWFIRSCKSVFTFGNFLFFSQKLHGYIFPFMNSFTFCTEFSCMQQNASMGPLRGENNQINHLYIMVNDVTEIASYEKRLIEMNTRDPLTEVYNRRFLSNRLQEEIERFKRYGRPFSIILQDIDHFKKVNDTYGHICGDFILKKFAHLNSERLRSVDIYTRYGGEEFCCILPETRLESAYKLAEDLRVTIEKQLFEFEGNKFNITMSQGAVEITLGVSNAEQLLKSADELLYEAKNTGRNKIAARITEM